jgi:hypothetical protein
MHAVVTGAGLRKLLPVMLALQHRKNCLNTVKLSITMKISVIDLSGVLLLVVVNHGRFVYPSFESAISLNSHSRI